MKHKGSEFPYKSERDAELMRVFRREMASCRHIVIKDIFKRVAESACSRFWVTEERAAIVLTDMMNGKFHCVGKCKAEMYKELYARFIRLKESNPYLPFSKLVFFSVNSPAPKFYLSCSQVRAIINRIRFSKSRPR